MNTVKYVNIKSGEVKKATCLQARKAGRPLFKNPSPSRHFTLAQLDRHMHDHGFQRAGKRWGSRAAIRAAAK